MELRIFTVVSAFLSFFELLRAQRVPEESLGRGCRASRGQFAHETFCHYYYNCWDGRATIEQCPGELLFNSITSTCDYPEAVNCGPRIRNPAPFVSGGRCLKEWGIFPDQQDCRAFYECAHGRAFRKVCPVYTAFDERYLVCVHAYNVQCGGRGGVYGSLLPGPVYPLDTASAHTGSGRVTAVGPVGGPSASGWDRNSQQQGSGQPPVVLSKGSNVGIPYQPPPQTAPVFPPSNNARGQMDAVSRSGVVSSPGMARSAGGVSSDAGGNAPGSESGIAGGNGQPDPDVVAFDDIPSAPNSSANGDNVSGQSNESSSFQTSAASAPNLVSGITGIVDDNLPQTDREKQYETPVSPDATFRCPHPRGLYGFALDCTKFWLCREYRPSLLKCPSGQLFDMASLTCTRPEKAQCATLTTRS